MYAKEKKQRNTKKKKQRNTKKKQEKRKKIMMMMKQKKKSKKPCRYRAVSGTHCTTHSKMSLLVPLFTTWPRVPHRGPVNADKNPGNVRRKAYEVRTM